MLQLHWKSGLEKAVKKAAVASKSIVRFGENKSLGTVDATDIAPAAYCSVPIVLLICITALFYIMRWELGIGIHTQQFSRVNLQRF